jgi:chromosomal replication initiator protein
MSRFQCGLVADIQAPDVETRVAILHAKAESEGQRLPGDVALHIANSARSNIRELEGAFTRLVALARLEGVPLHTVPVSLADRAIMSVVRQRPARVEVEDILQVVTRHFGVTVEQLRGKRRTAQIVEARQVAMALCRELTNLSLSEIGARFGKRDHTTVLYACDKIRGLEAKNTTLKRFLDAARQQLNGARSP